MNTSPRKPAPRDPMAPGAPVLPRSTWFLPPLHRWTFRHMREMTATSTVRRGQGPVRRLDYTPCDLSGVAFKAEGRHLTVESWLAESDVDAFLVLHRGKVVHESYHNGMQPHELHLSMSMAKSVLGLVCGILAKAGRLDLSAEIASYLPEIAETAYRGATVQHLLDMTSGVQFDESYDVAGSHMQKLSEAVAWGEGPRTPGWPQTVWQLILELNSTDRAHGDAFLYRSIETDLLGFVVERATGQTLSDLVSELIWQRIGAEEDGAYTLDHGGFALADGGFNATLRDYGRLALMLLEAGQVNGAQIVPATWIEEARFGQGGRFEGYHGEVFPGGGYHNQWWQIDRTRGVIKAQGIYGQCIYLDFENDFAAIKLSTWPTPLSVPRVRDRLAAFAAIERALASS